MVHKLVVGLLCCSLLFLFSCKKEYSNKEIVSWVKNPENGLRKSKEIDGLKLDVLYKPHTYLLADKLKDKDLSPEEYQKEKEQLGNLQYFDLRLGTVGKRWGDILNYKVNNVEEQQDRIHYLSYQMQNDLFLIEGNDTLKCRLYHFERSYDLAPHRTFLLGFEQGHLPNEDKILVLDSESFKTGPLKLKFRQEDLAKIPSPKL